VVVWFFKLIQPAVSTCFTFTSLISKVGYFLEIFIVKGTLIVDTYLHGARVEDFELHLGQAAIIGVSRAIKQAFFHFYNVYLLPYPDYT